MFFLSMRILARSSHNTPASSLRKQEKTGIHALAFPRELPHVWKVYTFEKCSYYKKLAFQKDDNNMVSITETNQNFS